MYLPSHTAIHYRTINQQKQSPLAASDSALRRPLNLRVNSNHSARGTKLGTLETRTNGYVAGYRLRFGRPALRRAGTVPWRFTPFRAGLADMPFDNLHCSRRELRGPWVLILVDLEVLSTSIASRGTRSASSTVKPSRAQYRIHSWLWVPYRLDVAHLLIRERTIVVYHRREN
jgi:hypothetical protein